MTPAQKKWIDNARYWEMLSKWRFAAIGDPMFKGECGEYFKKVMRKKRDEGGDVGHVAASKALGWNR